MRYSRRRRNEPYVRLPNGLSDLLFPGPFDTRRQGQSKKCHGLLARRKLPLYSGAWFSFIRRGRSIDMMPIIERSIEISATPQSVWSIVSDPSLTPKLFPDVVSITSHPPGLAALGQKNTIVAKVGGRRSEATFETTEVVPNQKLSLRQTSGGLLKKYVTTTTLSPMKKGTQVTTKVDYEVAAGFLGKILSVALVNRTVRNNILASIKNLKELAELKEMPGGTKG